MGTDHGAHRTPVLCDEHVYSWRASDLHHEDHRSPDGTGIHEIYKDHPGTEC